MGPGMTAEQFTQFIGVLFGGVIFFFGSWLLLTAFLHAVIDGWDLISRITYVTAAARIATAYGY